MNTKTVSRPSARLPRQHRRRAVRPASLGEIALTAEQAAILDATAARFGVSRAHAFEKMVTLYAKARID